MNEIEIKNILRETAEFAMSRCWLNEILNAGGGRSELHKTVEGKSGKFVNEIK